MGFRSCVDTAPFGGCRDFCPQSNPSPALDPPPTHTHPPTAAAFPLQKLDQLDALLFGLIEKRRGEAASGARAATGRTDLLGTAAGVRARGPGLHPPARARTPVGPWCRGRGWPVLAGRVAGRVLGVAAARTMSPLTLTHAHTHTSARVRAVALLLGATLPSSSATGPFPPRRAAYVANQRHQARVG